MDCFVLQWDEGYERKVLYERNRLALQLFESLRVREEEGIPGREVGRGLDRRVSFWPARQ